MSFERINSIRRFPKQQDIMLQIMVYFYSMIHFTIDYGIVQECHRITVGDGQNRHAIKKMEIIKQLEIPIFNQEKYSQLMDENF